MVLLGLIALAVSEYALAYRMQNNINMNFEVVMHAYERIAEIQKVAFHVRTLTFLKQNIFTNYGGLTQTQFMTSLQDEMRVSLDTLYYLQNDVVLSPLPVSAAQERLMNDKVTLLYFRETSGANTTIAFSLTEAMMQMQSSVFTISNLALDVFDEATSEDVYFYMANSMNDLLQALFDSGRLYVQALLDEDHGYRQSFVAIFACSLGLLLVSFVMLVPAVWSVSEINFKVLSLFCEISR